MTEIGEGQNVVGAESSDLSKQAERASATLHNKDLNPKPLSLIQKLGGLGAALGIAGASLIGYEKVKNANSDPDWFGQPIDEHVQIVDLQKVEDNLGNLQNPTFRDDPKGSSKELTPEKLHELGIDPSKAQRIIEVKGATYPSQYQAGNIEEDGERYGKWGQIVVTDPKTGKDMPTGVFISRNQYEPQQNSVNSNPAAK